MKRAQGLHVQAREGKKGESDLMNHPFTEKNQKINKDRRRKEKHEMKEKRRKIDKQEETNENIKDGRQTNEEAANKGGVDGPRSESKSKTGGTNGKRKKGEDAQGRGDTRTGSRSERGTTR